MSIAAALDELSALLGPRLTHSQAERDRHGASESYFAPAPPDAVAYPVSTAEVAGLVRICAAHRCPVIGFGAGTSLEGHTLAVQGGVAVDFTRMNRVLAVHDADMDAVVQPGLTREDLNRELRATGLFFPVDPGANATLGGMAATRASGTTAVRYGTMRDNVMALEVVLADGRVIRTGSRARKSAAGYDLTALFLGSEGTLGLITELTLRLNPQPEAISSAVVAFPTVAQTVDAVIAAIQSGIDVARIEFVDALSVEAFNRYARVDMPLAPHLLLEFHGSPDQVEAEAHRMAEVARDHGGSDFRWSAAAEERTALWTLRHNAYYACLALAPGKKAVVTDICVPVSNLARAITETAEDIAQTGLVGPILGHVGDGNFHSLLLVDPADTAELSKAKACAARMADRALALGGTVTGEHGIGMGKRRLMASEHGEGWAVMGALKAALDPAGILNPGKIVPD